MGGVPHTLQRVPVVPAHVCARPAGLAVAGVAPTARAAAAGGPAVRPPAKRLRVCGWWRPTVLLAATTPGWRRRSAHSACLHIVGIVAATAYAAPAARRLRHDAGDGVGRGRAHGGDGCAAVTGRRVVGHGHGVDHAQQPVHTDVPPPGDADQRPQVAADHGAGVAAGRHRRIRPRDHASQCRVHAQQLGDSTALLAALLAATTVGRGV